MRYQYQLNVLRQISDTCNQSLFFFAGFICYCYLFLSNIQLSHFAFVLLLYVLTHVARIATLFFSFPVLKNMGYGLRKRECLYVALSGLREAVALALVLLLEADSQSQNCNKDCRKNAEIVGFYVCGIVFLTLVVNGSLAKYFYVRLRMESGCSLKEKSGPFLITHLWVLIRNQIVCHESRLKNFVSQGADFEECLSVVPCLRDMFLGFQDGTVVFSSKHLLEEFSNNVVSISLDFRDEIKTRMTPYSFNRAVDELDHAEDKDVENVGNLKNRSYSKMSEVSNLVVSLSRRHQLFPPPADLDDISFSRLNIPMAAEMLKIFFDPKVARLQTD